MKQIVMLVVVLLVVFNLSIAMGAATEGDLSTVNNGALEAVAAYVDAIDEQDASALIALSPLSDSAELVAYFEDDARKNVGFRNVESAEIVIIKPLDAISLLQSADSARYRDLYGNVPLGFLVGIDMSVENEDEYFYNGVNFALLVTAVEYGTVKIVEFSSASRQLMDKLITENEIAESEAVSDAFEIKAARSQGLILNGEKQVIKTNKASEEQLRIERGIATTENAQSGKEWTIFMKTDANLILPLQWDALQQSALHQSTLRKLQERLQQQNTAPIAGADQIIWGEAEQTMRKDGFAKLALEKDTTLSGISAEFSASVALGKTYTGIAENAGESDISLDFYAGSLLTLTDVDKDLYNAQMAVTAALNGESYMYLRDSAIGTIRCVDDMTYREDPNKFYPNAEEIRSIFADSIDESIKKLREDYDNGAISEDEYKDRQNKINEAYDKFAYKYGNYGLTNYYYMQVNYGTDVFSAWEDSLNDIKTRYERGDFGFGEGVYEERLAAWSAAFDEWADKEVKTFMPTAVMGIAAREFSGGTTGETELYREDMRKLYENAKAHLLAGNAAQDLTDDILNKGLSYATAADRRFFFSDEYAEMIADIHEQAGLGTNKSKTQSQDKEEWENLYERLAMQVKSDSSLSETLRNMLLRYFDFATVRLPQIFKGNFLSG
jgi:hypothetical protein